MVIIKPALRPRVFPPAYCRRPPALPVALLLIATHATAAEWTVTPSFGLREIFSDNINLTPESLARSDLVTELSPAISVGATGLRFKLNAGYAFHYFDYHHGTSPSRTQHEANANANGELVKELLFVDATANVSQQRISTFGPQSIDNANVTGNSTEAQIYSISPYVRYHVSDFALGELRYTQQKTKMSDTDLFDANTSRVYVDVNGGARFHRLGWDFKLDRQRIEYSNAPHVELGMYTGTLRYALMPLLVVNATAGYENNNYLSLGEDTDGRLWSVGFAWTPSEMTSVAASTGHRFYGKTFNLSANHRTARATWNVGYNEDVTTTSAHMPGTVLGTADFLNQLWVTRIPDAAARQAAVDTFIRNAGLPATLTVNVNGLSNNVFLQKSLQASVALDGARNTVVLRLFGSRREPLSVPNDTLVGTTTELSSLDDNSRQVGASAVWSWHLSPRSDLDFGVNYARLHSLTSERTDRDRSVRVGLTTKVSQKLSGTFEWRRQLRSSTEAGAAYRENAIVLLALMQF